MLKGFIGDWEPAAFWEQVDANFKAGRIKLVFVADEIPRDLARIVEFLKEQMRADVRAVELRWFTGEGGVTTHEPKDHRGDKACGRSRNGDRGRRCRRCRAARTVA